MPSQWALRLEIHVFSSKIFLTSLLSVPWSLLPTTPRRPSGATSEVMANIASRRLSSLRTEPYSGHHGREHPLSQPWLQGITTFPFRSIAWTGAQTRGEFPDPRTVPSQWEATALQYSESPLISEPVRLVQPEFNQFNCYSSWQPRCLSSTSLSP